MLMNPLFIGSAETVMWLLLAVPAAILLVLSYQKTRMSGFIWLTVSVVLWPFVARTLTLVVNTSAPAFISSRALTPETYLSYMMLFALAEIAVGGVLLLVSCYVLYRQIVVRFAPPASTAAVVYEPLDTPPPAF